eukprot:1159005-Pelagomonas_calceolata.AAC.5
MQQKHLTATPPAQAHKGAGGLTGVWQLVNSYIRSVHARVPKSLHTVTAWSGQLLLLECASRCISSDCLQHPAHPSGFTQADHGRVKVLIHKLDNFDGTAVAEKVLGIPTRARPDRWGPLPTKRAFHSATKLCSFVCLMLIGVPHVVLGTTTAQVNEAPVWSELAHAQLRSGEVAEAIASYLLAQDSSNYSEVCVCVCVVLRAMYRFQAWLQAAEACWYCSAKTVPWLLMLSEMCECAVPTLEH